MNKHTILVQPGDFSPNEISPETKRIINLIGRYHRAIETKDFIYFVNYQESDENAQAMMYRKSDLSLVSDNYFAASDLFNVLENKEYTYISHATKKGFTKYQEVNA
jgi:hypothetical protein